MIATSMVHYLNEILNSNTIVLYLLLQTYTPTTKDQHNSQLVRGKIR